MVERESGHGIRRAGGEEGVSEKPSRKSWPPKLIECLDCGQRWTAVWSLELCCPKCGRGFTLPVPKPVAKGRETVSEECKMKKKRKHKAKPPTVKITRPPPYAEVPPELNPCGRNPTPEPCCRERSDGAWEVYCPIGGSRECALNCERRVIRRDKAKAIEAWNRMNPAKAAKGKP